MSPASYRLRCQLILLSERAGNQEELVCLALWELHPPASVDTPSKVRKDRSYANFQEKILNLMLLVQSVLNRAQPRDVET